MLRRMTRDRYLSDAELAAFMAAVRERRHVHQPRDHALFALLANTGIRPSEALALTRADCHLGGKLPWIRLRRVGKRHTPQPTNELVIHRAVAEVVRRYVNESSAEVERLFPFTRRQSERLFHYYRRKAGIAQPHKIYCLRHSAGMRLVRFVKDLRLVQAIMGHSGLRATMVYAHVSPERLQAAYEAAGTAG
jgi:site-specific recombinase XerD